MSSKIFRLLILLISVLALISCSVGGKDDNEQADDGTYYIEPEEICEGPPAFTYSINPDNAAQPFNAYGKTQVRIIHTGNCIYSINLALSAGGETYQVLSEGFGNINLLRVYDLPENNYIINAHTEGGCSWSVEIESLKISGCEEEEEEEEPDEA